MRLRTTTLALASLATLVPLGTAQDDSSPFVLQTAKQAVAQKVQQFFGDHTDLPELGDGEHWECSLDDGGLLTVGTRAGDIGVATCSLSPCSLMEIFAEQIGPVRAAVQGSVAMGMGQIGIPTAEAVKISRAFWSFPSQIARIHLQIRGDLAANEGQGMRIELRIVPAKDSWLAKFVAGVRPAPQGAPTYPGGNAYMTVAWAGTVGPYEIFAPFEPFFVRLGKGTPEEYRSRAKMLRSLWSSSDGLGFASVGPDRRVVYLEAISDPDGVRTIMADKIYVDWLRAAYQLEPGVEEVELKANALVHNGVSLHRTTQYHEDEEIVHHDGMAGRYALQLADVPEREVKKIIDKATAGKFAFEPLGPGGIMRIDVRLAEFVEWAAEGVWFADAEEMPEHLQINIRKEQNSILVQANLRG